MGFDPGTWWLVALLASVALGVIGYFLKQTMDQVRGHGKDIQDVKRTYATKEDIKELRTEMKEQRTEIKDELEKISGNMDEIKQNSISKVDFYRAMDDTNGTVKNIYDLLIQQRTGGKSHEP